jgi:curved DNA-binding protein CbpA
MVSTNGLHRRRQTLDYYAVLGVAENASFGEIRDAYWKLAFRIDRRDLDALNEAYEVLGDDQRRTAYNKDRRVGGLGLTPQP